MGPQTAPKGYRFGVFEVECAAASLRREGTLVRLRGKPFDILLYLLARPGDLVSRDELRQHLWGADTFVDFDHGLNAAMNRLRDALGDKAENPRFIQTLPRRGYRFIAPVESIGFPSRPEVAVEGGAVPSAVSLVNERAPAPAPIVRPGWRGRASMAAAAALVVLLAAVAASMFPLRAVPRARPMLAVLPFQNLSGSKDQDYFSDGFTDELIAQLGALNPNALGVIARTTVDCYRDGRQSIQEIGKALDVEYVLEGSVRRNDSHVRITATLVDVRTQTQLWAESYDHDVRDVLLTQRDVAMNVASSLTMSVLRAATVRQMPSAEAYDATLRGVALRQQGTEASLVRAREYFEHAIQLDPTYAPAQAGLADVYLVLASPGWEFDRPRDLLPKALAAAGRAIELDPRLPDGYAVRGLARLWFHRRRVGSRGGHSASDCAQRQLRDGASILVDRPGCHRSRRRVGRRRTAGHAARPDVSGVWNDGGLSPLLRRRLQRGVARVRSGARGVARLRVGLDRKSPDLPRTRTASGREASDASNRITGRRTLVRASVFGLLEGT